MRREEGTIVKLGDNYFRVQATCKYPDPKTGKKPRLSAYVRGSRREAQRRLDQLLIDAGKVRTISITFREFVSDHYLPYLKKRIERGRLKQRTYDSYEERLRLHILPLLGDLPLSMITADDVRYVQSQAQTEAMERELRKTMSVVFKEAVYEGLLEDNPIVRVRPPDPAEYDPEILNFDELLIYMEHFKGTRIENVVLLAIGGAYRRGELDALNVEDIDLETGEVIVDNAIGWTKEGYQDNTPKNGKARITVLPEFILERLRLTLPRSGPVAVNYRMERMRPDTISAIYRKYRATLPEGVPRIPLKNLRHTCLTMAYDATGNVDQVADHGGHSAAVSRRHYIRQHLDQEHQLADAMDEYYREHVH